MEDIMKKGFTLAETLITIGLVGIVAALTLPLLISKYNEKAAITQLRKTYVELSQSIQMSEVHNGSFRDWDYSLPQKEFAEQYILPYLAKGAQKCNSSCFAGENYWKKINGTFNENGEYFVAPHYKYNDKTIVINNQNIQRQDMNDIKYVNFIVDINGDRGASIMGKDVFMFTLFNYTYLTGSWSTTPLCSKGEHYGLYLGSIGSYWGSYCGTLEGILGQDSVRGSCKPNGSGDNCGLAIEKNGWKIPDKYPIKF